MRRLPPLPLLECHQGLGQSCKKTRARPNSTGPKSWLHATYLPQDTVPQDSQLPPPHQSPNQHISRMSAPQTVTGLVLPHFPREKAESPNIKTGLPESANDQRAQLALSQPSLPKSSVIPMPMLFLKHLSSVQAVPPPLPYARPQGQEGVLRHLGMPPLCPQRAPSDHRLPSVTAPPAKLGGPAAPVCDLC